jgi:hypothetical protein
MQLLSMVLGINYVKAREKQESNGIIVCARLINIFKVLVKNKKKKLN